MDRNRVFLPFVGLVSLVLGAADVAAQSSVTSTACLNPSTTCFPISGSVVFEAGETPPAEALVRVRLRTGQSNEVLEFRTPGPAYRFEARVPRFSESEFRLIGLPTPWLDDQVVTVTALAGPRGIELRSAAGVPVTATFRYPPGTTAPPPFTASVRRSPGDRWFTPVTVSDGQLVFLARRDQSYTIAAAPQGFGNVAATFPPQAFAHPVSVDVQRRALPASQQAVLVEGPAATAAARRLVMVPLVLEERSPSGGGRLPYDVAIDPGTTAPDTLVATAPAEAGSRQRIALQRVAITNDATVNGPRAATLRFTPNPADAAAAPALPITLLDDEAANLPPLMSVVGAALAADGQDTSMVLARPEGGPGDGWTLTLQLDRPAPEGGVSVTVDTVTGTELEFPDPFRFVYPGTLAVDGVDFQPVVQQRITFAAGERTATVRIEGIGNNVIQPERRLFIAFTEPQGLAPRDPSIQLRIINDDVDESPAARNDQFAISPLPQSNVLDILANDVLPAARFEGGRVEVIEAPQFGSIIVLTGGTATPLDDRLSYAPSSGGAGRVDRLRYRVCTALDALCVDARVDLPIRPVTATATAFAPDSDGGFRDFGFSGVTVLSEARADLLARPIASAEIREFALAPSVPRFGIDWQAASTALPTLPPGEAARRAFVAHLRGPSGSDVDLHVAYDANNNGIVETTERLCSSSGTGAVETCLVNFEQTSAGATTLLVATSNPGPAPVPVRLVVGSVSGLGPLPGVTATMPTRLAAGEAFTARVSWRNDATPLPNGAIGVLRINNSGDAGLGDIPFVIDLPRADTALARAPALAPLALRSGTTYSLPLSSSGTRDGVFIDVPAGTAQLSVALARTGTLQPLEVSLRRAPLPTDGANPAPSPAPAADDGTIIRTMTGASLEVAVASPAAGRWYLVLADRNATPLAPATVQATATLGAASAAPVVGPGGYFNAARSGHGLFLYPSGSEWVGLWYTYQQDGEPVWYYLQGPAPGTNGIWTAPIFRSAWNGTANRLIEIGRAVATPTGTDAFQFTYVLDGETGSEPFSTFGRGCPAIDGRTINASGHWFNPARAGAGYSVQLFPNYEFHAVFAYSPRGEPRFLLAERAGVGATNDVVPLQQLRGFCPLCTRAASPERSTVGTLRREFTNGVLTRLSVDAAYTNGTAGGWAVTDPVVPLGGLQGCTVD